MGYIGQKPADAALTATQISDGIITEAKLASNAVTSTKIAEGTVVAADIADGSVTVNKLGSASVETAKIATANVTNSLLAAEIDIKGNLTVQAGSVGSPALRANSDSNTGIYFPTSDSVGIVTGGSERANVDPLGFFTAVYGDKLVALGNTGTNPNIDCTLGSVFTATLNSDTTITLANAKPTGVSTVLLVLTNDSTPSRTVALSGGTFLYPTSELTRTSTASNTDVWFFMTTDGGSNWFVNIPMKDLGQGSIS